MPKKNYDYHGGKSDEIRDLTRKVVTKRQKDDKLTAVEMTPLEIRHAIKGRMDRKVSKNEVTCALVSDTTRPDGEVVLSKRNGEPSFLFHSKEVMAMLEVVYAELRKKPNPATKPPALKLAHSRAA